MHRQLNRDRRVLHLDDLRRRDVELHQLMDLNCDMDLMHLPHLLLLDHLDVVQNLDALVHLHQQDVVHLDAQQNLDVVRPDVVHLDALHPLVVVVDAELRHLLRMDYYQDEVDVELPHLPRMDYCLDVAHLEEMVLLALQELKVHLELLCMQQLQQMLPALLHVMP